MSNLLQDLYKQDQTAGSIPCVWEVSFQARNDDPDATDNDPLVIDDFIDVSASGDGQQAIDKARAFALSASYAGAPVCRYRTSSSLKGLKLLAKAEL